MGFNMNTISYETDIVAWANEQAELIRTGQFNLLDLEHIAEEIEDVGSSKRNELAHRMSLLLMHLLKWEFQPENRSPSWEGTIREQRRALKKRLLKTPSLKPSIEDADWLDEVWGDARIEAARETGIGFARFPSTNPWSMDDVLTDEWLPPEISSASKPESSQTKKPKRSTRKKTAA